jgi:hypothetical protein
MITILAKNKNSKKKPISSLLVQMFFAGKRSPDGKSKNGCATCKQEIKIKN